mmetsp:Transcript_33445/g.92432  ORF Transcript_33445/g.92432 Transcript_33445/m.92432 type:complete len:183 (+) Transcript_33445:54-602(+)
MVRNDGRSRGLDTSFLPGPQRVAPHLQELGWRNRIDREENFVCGGGSANVPRAPTSRINPITWESPVPSRAGTGIGRAPDVLCCNRPETGASYTTRLSSASTRSSRSNRSRGFRNRGGASRQLSTAGSIVSSVPSRLSSILSAELEAEKQGRAAAEREVQALKKQLADVADKTLADRSAAAT